jgi:Cu/Ag efflux protein CusF
MMTTRRNLIASLGALPVIASLLAVGNPAYGSELAHGEIRKIDKAAAKITIKHGDIPSIDMPPMTMVFGVKDAALLENVKAGDKIRFDVVQEGGKYIVTRLEGVR